MHRVRRVIAVVLSGLSISGPAVVATVRPASAAPAGYVRVLPAGRAEQVVADAGHAYATNYWQNRVEVVSLATGQLEASVPVGTGPQGLDLSADGRRLYVANQESKDISVVDLASRAEVGRIAIPSATGKPTAIAVAANGVALVTVVYTTNSSLDPRLWQVDLATGAVRERTEWRGTSLSGDVTTVRASGDRSKIAYTTGTALAVYTAATDTFGSRHYYGDAEGLAVDGPAATMLSGPDTFVADKDLTLRATVPGHGLAGLALNQAGTTGYRTNGGSVEVIDPRRGLVTATITIAGATGLRQLALTPDGSTLVGAADAGIAVVPVSAAVPTPCPVSGPAGVAKVCAPPLADVVFDGKGRAYASNPQRNEVEVFSVASGNLESAIPVGSQPRDIELSPDGTKLYVANTGAEDVSVVDLGGRREIARWTMPASLAYVDRPLTLAAATNGTVFLTTSPRGYAALPTRFFQFDAIGVAHERSDTHPNYVWSSGDHTRIVASDPNLRVYDSSTDTFALPTEIDGDTSRLAVDRTGSHMVLSGVGPRMERAVTVLLDGGLTRRASVPGFAWGLGIDPAGTVAYRVQARSVEVVDLARGLLAKSVSLPEQIGVAAPMAVSPDGATLAVVTPSGLAFVATSAATPVATCPAAAIPARVAPTCGPVADIVADDAGHAYATNPDRNEIAVLSVATGRRESSIPVGSQPWGLDLSADGKTLYVADSGAAEISVVDLVQHKEVRRITVPPNGIDDRPEHIAVGDQGIALVTTTTSGGGIAGRVVSVNLATGVTTLRTDSPPYQGSVGPHALVEASGDRTRIEVFEDDSGGAIWTYMTATDSFGPVRSLSDYPTAAAVDRAGSHTLVNGTWVLDGALQTVATVPPSAGTSYGVAVSPDGTTGYRVLSESVEAIDLAHGTVTRALPLPESSVGAGSVGITPDGSALVVATKNGLTVLHPTDGTVVMQIPQSMWRHSGYATLDGTGSWMGMVNEPAAGPGQLPPSYLYVHSFTFANSASVGAVGLAADPSGRYAVFAVNGVDGAPRVAVAPFNWQAGRFYFPFVYQTAPGQWGAWVYDYTAAAWTPIGVFNLPATWGALTQDTATGMAWYGPSATGCAAYPRADAVFYPPTDYYGTTPQSAEPSQTTVTAGDCPTQTSVVAGAWQRSEMGT